MIVVYSDGSEVIVGTEAREQELITLYFVEGGRDKDDYTRTVVTGCAVDISSKVNWS